MASFADVDIQKRSIRQEFALRRKQLDAEVRRDHDAAICANIRALPAFQASEYVAAFIRHGAEVDLSPLFKGKRLLLPRFDLHRGVYEMVAVEDLELDLLPGKYNIPEPLPSLPAADPDIVASQALFLVPAVACDRAGHRLGRGGGFYDRLLAGVKTPPAAVIYSCQLSETELPGTEYDIPMGVIVTEREVIYTHKGE